MQLLSGVEVEDLVDDVRVVDDHVAQARDGIARDVDHARHAMLNGSRKSNEMKCISP